jgi:hypothetical protein
VFYTGIGGTSAAKQRDQLYTCVHELGHCFNLYHSFHKTYMNPPMPNRLTAFSWMNYPWRYPGGPGVFWAGFPFQFDTLETVHLRHAFRNNIIMGGNPFGTGAALEDPEVFPDPIEDKSGLRLELEAPKPALRYGEPCAVEIKLYLDGAGSVVVHKHDHLHPNFGFVQIAIQKPSGEIIVHEPPLDHCVEVETEVLSEDNPSIYASAYIGYDKHAGQIFADPGVYKLKGLYHALDGSMVMSRTISVRVRAPLTEEDEVVGEALLGEDQGMLFYLIGSRGEVLKDGIDAFDMVLKEHGDHPLAVYPRFVQGVAWSKEFKQIGDDFQVKPEPPDPATAIEYLSSVVDLSEAGQGLDNISLNEAMHVLAAAQMGADDESAARATVTRLGAIFRKKDLKPHVDRLIKEQQAALRKALF